MDLDLPLSTILVVGILIVTIIWNALRPLSAASLNPIPGPWLAKITSYYIIIIDVAGNRTQHIHKVHQRYGSVVRIGPNEISFTSPSSVNKIYNHGTPYMKAPWYDYMPQPAGLFALRDRKAHSERRRLFSHAFSQSSLNDAEPTIAELISKMVDIVDSAADGPIDMLLLCRRLSLEIVGQLFLGQSFQALDMRELPEFLEWMDNLFFGLGIQYAFPVVFWVMQFLPLRGAQDIICSAIKIREYGEKAFYKYIQVNGRQSKRRDLLTEILIANDEVDTDNDDHREVKAQPLSDAATILEIGNSIFAGTDTTSTTLTYLFWELARNQSWQDRLREELKSRVPEDTIVPEYNSVSDLPILDAIVNESLRLHPAVPSSLPRSTPEGGRMFDGYFIPEGTVVSTQCYTTHRDPLAFPNPETFKPDRWLNPPVSSCTDKDADHITRSKTLFIPFSRGPRACLGIGLAIMELKLTTAALVLFGRIRVAPGTTEESMDMVDHFIAVPKGGRCELLVEGFQSRVQKR